MGIQRRTTVKIIDDKIDNCSIEVHNSSLNVRQGEIPRVLLTMTGMGCDHEEEETLFHAAIKRESDDKRIHKIFNATGDNLDQKFPLYLTDLHEEGSYHIDLYRIYNGGLSGTYFADNMMSDKMKTMQRIDSAVNFTWNQDMTVAPTATRWNGFLKPPDSVVRCCNFFIEGNDVRLWINNILIIDDWHQPTSEPLRSAFTDLSTANPSRIYEVTLEARHSDDSMPSAKFMWNLNGHVQVISQEYLFFKVRNLFYFPNFEHLRSINF